MWHVRVCIQVFSNDGEQNGTNRIWNNLEFGQIFLLFGTNVPRVINKSKGSESI